MTITRAKIDVSIPRKRRGDCSQHEKGLNKFYDQVGRTFWMTWNFRLNFLWNFHETFMKLSFTGRSSYFEACQLRCSQGCADCFPWFCQTTILWLHVPAGLFSTTAWGSYQISIHALCQAVKTDNKLLFENKSKFLLVHASSGFKHALKEVLADPAVQARLADTKASEEVAGSKISKLYNFL